MRNPELLESIEDIEELAELEPKFNTAKRTRIERVPKAPNATLQNGASTRSATSFVATAQATALAELPAEETVDSDSDLLRESEPLAIEELAPAELVSTETAKQPLSLAARMAFALAPIYGTLYDLQMQLGGGVRVVRQRIQVGQYPRGVPPLRAAYISDLHYGPTSGRVAARQAWRQAREAEPDILLLGGDFLYGDERGLPSLLRELQRWKRNPPPAGMYACLGNHDHYGNCEALITCLEACGVRVLLNDAVELPAPWNDVWIVGTDDIHVGDPQPELALAGVPVGACAIMLSHSPDICEYNALKRCGLTLCGHTHGGQVCLPNGDAPYLPSKWGKHYPAGIFRHAGSWIYVSRGVGTVSLPVRMWAPPDIGVFEIVGTVRSTTAMPLRQPGRNGFNHEEIINADTPVGSDTLDAANQSSTEVT
ncbi:MAG: metallophosphoesterase [Abitibacteriaceae bacterium]|nr:metallophosphoesterase [Abditibacteriaceae bacterium]MBV9866904.1 metallophosphoesterase [Abditibacteriaceae bacterium]